MALAALALPAISGTLGAIEGARRGGLGGAILGGTAGALTPAGLRLAGTALGGVPALAGLAQKGTMLGRGALGLQGPVQAGSKLVAGAVPALGLAFGAPQLVGGLAGGIARPAGQAAGTAGQVALGNLAYTAPGPNQYGGQPYLTTDMYGNIPQYGASTDVMGVAGTGQRLDMYKTGETQRDINRLMNAENYALREASAKQDMARDMAAAGIRQNIATRAAMQQRAQGAGIEAGRQALADAGAILRNQYQYQ